MIRENLEDVQERIIRACQRSRRDVKDLTLVAVSKKVPTEKVGEALRLGIGHFGESYIQEAGPKIKSLTTQARVVWHMLGRLQTNKAGRAVEMFDLIQSVDSQKLLRYVDRKAGELNKVQECLIEIKLSEEITKAGLPESEIGNFFESAKGFKNIRIKGIMTMAPFYDSPESARPIFKKARQIFEKRFIDNSSAILSMGMSGDFETAIEEGSTMVRVGQAIFGARA